MEVRNKAQKKSRRGWGRGCLSQFCPAASNSHSVGLRYRRTPGKAPLCEDDRGTEHSFTVPASFSHAAPTGKAVRVFFLLTQDQFMQGLREAPSRHLFVTVPHTWNYLLSVFFSLYIESFMKKIWCTSDAVFTQHLQQILLNK